MNDYPSNVKEKLNFIISDMANPHWLFANRPGHDFMRQNHGKLSFYDTMRLIISMGKGNTNDEIMDYFDLDPDRIPPSLPSIKEGLRFLFPLLNISFRNSRQPFLPLLILLKTIASWLVMVVMLFTQQVPKLSKILISHTLLIIKVITICILTASLMLLAKLLLTLLYRRVKSLMNVRLSTPFLANEAVLENQKKKRRTTNKHQYEVDFSSALKISRKYFIRGRSSENRIIKLIAKYIHAVKCKFRQFSRPLRGIGAIHFGYR